MKRSLIAVTLAALMMAPLARVTSEVTVIRQPPNSGTNSAEAEWSAPLALPHDLPGQGLKQPGDFSGRLKVGGTAEQNDGKMGYDSVTDSLLSYTRRTGPDSVSHVSVQAYRQSSFDSLEEQYEIAGGLAGEKLTLDLSANFGKVDSVVTDVDRSDQDILLAASVTTLMMPSLPVTLSYQMAEDRREEGDAVTTDLITHDVELSAVGTVGSSGLELEGHFLTNTDHATVTESLAGGGKALVTVPTAESLAILIGVEGDYGLTRYGTGNESALVSAGASLGGVLTPDLGSAQELEIQLVAARNDSFPDQTGPEADPGLDEHTVTWSGELQGAWSAEIGFHVDPLYGAGWTDTGVWTHDAAVAAGWTSPDETILRQVETEGRLALSVDEEGTPLNDEKGWGADFTLVPAQDMSLATNYAGTRRASGGSDFWSHKGGLDWTHAPHRLLDYGAGVGVGANLDGSSLTRLSQDYTALVNLKPEISTGTMVTGLRETFSIVRQAGSDDQHSQLQWNLDAPLRTQLSAGYGFGWEWTAQDLETQGHSFRHDTRLSLSGEDVPLDVTLTYAYSHGYLGIRHDGESLVVVPLVKGYSLENRFTISHYKENGRTETPFLVELSVVYVF